MINKTLQFKNLLFRTIVSISLISLSLASILFMLYVLGELWNISPFDLFFLKAYFFVPSIVFRDDPLKTNGDMGSARLGYGAIIAGISMILNIIALPFVSGAIYLIFITLRRLLNKPNTH